MATETAPSPEATPKFSRYRSVRRAQAQQPQFGSADQLEQTPPVPAMPLVPSMEHELQKDATVSRSMSRYHRRPTNSQAKTASQTVHVPPLPTVAHATSSAPRIRATGSPQTSSSSHTSNNGQPRLSNTSKSRSDVSTAVTNGTRDPPETARAEAKQLIQIEAERHRRMHEKLKAEKRAKLEADEVELERQNKLRLEGEEAERLRAEREAQQEVDDLEQSRLKKEELEHGRRLQKAESSKRLKYREEEERKAKYELAARKAQGSPPVSPPKHERGFGIFRRRKDDSPASPDPPANTARPRQDIGKRDLDTIKAGGGGAVLGIDAPISAVNAGDRRVMVVCNKSRMLLPITPTTTPLMLLKSASICLAEPIDVRTAVLLESFQKVGVQRPLRNYEHVRDVMNSWDDDKQNDLVIVDAVNDSVKQQDLLASQAPDEKPANMGCYIHYSSKPGKWTKRYLTLRSDGQLVMAKSESSKEKDQENICHLSDFDIYSPTQRKLSKVKPPKKICYAVKSQQRSSMFMDETRFVHFFCTNDRNTAALFYRSLQSWRSWYLKHVMGEGQQKTKALEPKVMNGRNVEEGIESGRGTVSHARNASVESHYQLGTFAPLLDLGHFKTEPKEEAWKPGSFPDDQPLGRLDTRAMHARKMSTRAKAPPPISYNPNVIPAESTPKDANRHNPLPPGTSSQPEGHTFAPTGLLGRQYLQRQRTVQERGEKKVAEAFTDGPSLLNNMNFSGQLAVNDIDPGPRSPVRGHHRRMSSDVQRNISIRSKPKPLVDLTPQYREPPQHAGKKGKGFHADRSAGPLVENAVCITRVEDAIQIPSSTDWRARPTTNHGTYGTGGHERTRSLKGRGETLAAYAVNNHNGAPTDNAGGFTGGGLLGRANYSQVVKHSQGDKPVGYGVMDGSKAKGPMIDPNEASQFPQGSLVATIEKAQAA